MLCYEEPESTKQISQEENEYDQTENLEAFDVEDLSHDLIVIDCTIIAFGIVVVDHLDKLVSVSLANQVGEVLQV